MNNIKTEVEAKPELALAHEIEAELKKEEERELTIAELLNVVQPDSQRRV